MRHNTVHRASAAALVVALLGPGLLKSQVDSWQLVAGVGGVTGTPLAPVFVGALGRDVSILSNFRLGAELTTAHLPDEHFICLDADAAASCDTRSLEHFGALSITAAIAAPAVIVTPYARVNTGAWIGRDVDATADQSSNESGFTVAGEAGIRLRHIAAALRVDQLNRARRGTLHIASIVFRASF